MESLYKSKGKFGVLGREKRVESNKLRTREMRQSIIAARRNLPTEELNVTKSPLQTLTNKFKAKNSPLKSKPTDRLQRLREWQQTRAEAKAKAKSEKKRPVFAVRKCEAPKPANVKASISFRPQISFSAKIPGKTQSPKVSSKTAARHKKIPYSTKNAVLSMSPKPVRPPPPSRPPSRPVTAKMETVKENRNQQNDVKKPAKSLAKKPGTKKALPTRCSARLATKQTTSSAAKQATSIKSSEGRKTCSAKPTGTKKDVVSKKTVGAGKNPATQASGSKSVSAAKKEKKSPVRKQTVGVKPTPVDVPACVPPTTPKKSYQPIYPSPLLSCRSASKLRRSDAAWIPGAPAPDCPSDPSFENMFSSKFSPFRFTAGSSAGQDFQFQFQMDIQEAAVPAGESSGVAGETESVMLEANEASSHSDSLHSSIDRSITQISDNAPVSELEDLITFSDTSDCSMTEEIATPKLRRSSRNITRKCYSSTKRRRKSTVPLGDVDHTQKSVQRQDNEVVQETEVLSSSPAKAKLLPKSDKRRSRRSFHQVSTKAVERVVEGVVRNLAAEFDTENSLEQNSESTSTSTEEEGEDFRKLHSDVCKKLLSLCEKWEGKGSGLEGDDQITDLDEVLGQIRATCCKGRLVLGKKSKLTQFLGLVEAAESESSGDKKTTAQDLMGFWDMVFNEVSGLYKDFDQLAEIEKNGWQCLPPSPKKPKLQKRRKNAKTSSKAESSEPSEKALAARKRREAARAKLKELRMNATITGKENEPVDSTIMVL